MPMCLHTRLAEDDVGPGRVRRLGVAFDQVGILGAAGLSHRRGGRQARRQREIQVSARVLGVVLRLALLVLHRLIRHSVPPGVVWPAAVVASRSG